MLHSRALLLALTLAVLSLPTRPAAAAAQAAQRPWLDSSLPPGRRADLALAAMTRSEKLSLVFGYMGSVMPSFLLASEVRLPAWSHAAQWLPPARSAR